MLRLQFDWGMENQLQILVGFIISAQFSYNNSCSNCQTHELITYEVAASVESLISIQYCTLKNISYPIPHSVPREKNDIAFVIFMKR